MADAPLILDESAVRRLIDMDDLIEAMQAALVAFSRGEVVQPVRQFVEVTRHSGFLGLMPAAGQAMGVKLVTFYPNNAEHDLHTHHALIVLFRPQTGQPLAVMDGRLITAMRTAAVSAVATRLLAADPSPVLAILGSGVQAGAHVEALSRVRRFDEIRVWSRNAEHARRFARGIDARVMDAEAAVRGADVVVTCTAAKEPILRGEWLKPGAHVNAVGWNGPDSRELDDAAMANVVFVESRDAAADQCGDVRRSGVTPYAEIGEALADRVPPRRDATTVFDSVGMAVEDVAAAAEVLRRAQR